MAEKSVGYVFGDDPATVEANRKHQEALDMLTSSLDTRKNRFFDPVWLAAAEGFLGPTKTGSFYESLGRVAGKVGTAEENMAKEDQLIAQQRVAATGQGLEMQRQKNVVGTLLNNFPGETKPPPPVTEGTPAATSKPPEGALSAVKPEEQNVAPLNRGALTAAVAPAAAPAAVPAAIAPPVSTIAPPIAAPAPVGALSAARPQPQAATPVAPAVAPAVTGATAPGGALTQAEAPPPGYGQGVPFMPPDTSYISPRQYLATALLDKNKSPADALKEAEEIGRRRYEYKDFGVVDRKTGLLHSTSGKQVDATVFGVGEGKTYNIPESVAMRLTQLGQAGNETEYNKLAAQFIKGFGQEGRPTSLEDKARRNKLSEADTTQEIEYRKDFNAKNAAAREVITNAEYFRNISKDPKADKMFGIFTNDKVSSAIANLVSDGVGVTGYTIGVPAIKKIMTNLGLDKKEDSAKLQVFLMNVAQQQLLSEKYLKGATSDRERNLLAEASINKDDTPTSIRMKADILTRRAQFDQEAYKAYKAAKKKSDISAEDFLDSKQYEDMLNSYVKELSDISVGNAKLGRREDAPKGSGLPGAKARVDEVLGRGK